MAGRPIKEDGINSNMTNKQIADRYQSLVKEKNEHIKSLEDEIKKLNLELKEKSLELRKYETQKIIMLTEKETIKKILMYFAKGKTYKTIYDKMVYVGFDGTIEYIKNICENIETLENDLVLYYNQQLKDYEESVKVNPNLINDILIQVLKQNINDASQDLEGLTDTKEKSILRAEITKHAKEINSLVKNLVEEKKDSNNKIDDVNKVMENYNENKIMSFKAVKKRVD